MAEKFVGKWKLIESENFDEYMKAVGVGMMTRKLGSVVKPVLTIKVDGNKWSMLSESTFKNVLCEFELGKEFDETTADGRVLKSVFTLTDDGKLMQKQTKIKDSDHDSKFTRYVEGNRLIITCESEGVTAKRIYERTE